MHHLVASACTGSGLATRRRPQPRVVIAAARHSHFSAVGAASTRTLVVDDRSLLVTVTVYSPAGTKTSVPRATSGFPMRSGSSRFRSHTTRFNPGALGPVSLRTLVPVASVTAISTVSPSYSRSQYVITAPAGGF